MMVPSLRYYLDGKRPLDLESHSGWDIFVSAFNDSDRVIQTYQKVRASRKQWWVIPEYAYSAVEHPRDGTDVIDLPHLNEADLIIDGVARIGIDNWRTSRVCIDITGFMRPHILFLMRYLAELGIDSYDLLYTEPMHYARKSETEFALDEDSVVRQVAGYEGQHIIDLSHDILILGGGYDHTLVGRVIMSKENARIVQLHGFPSLSADMYHESLLRLDRISNTADLSQDSVFFSSANDPFVTAATLSEAVSTLQARKRVSNLYLSTLSTKAQAVGFGIYYLTELIGKPASIIFPFFKRYARELRRAWEDRGYIR